MEKKRNRYANMKCWKQMLNDHNKHYVINVRMKLLQADKEAMNNNFNFLLLIPMKFMWIGK